MTRISNLGRVIAHLRHMMGWSQESLAASADVSTRTVQRIEEGRPAALETVAAIARVFEMDIETLCSMAVWLDVSPTMTCLLRAYTGRHVVAGIRNAQACAHMIHTEERVIRDAALALVSAASEWSDLLDDAASEGPAERNLGDLLDMLHSAGGRLFYGRMPLESEFRDLQKNFISLDTLILVVYPDDHSQIHRDGEQEFVYVGKPETEDVLRKHA